MTRNQYEQHKKRLEEQLRAGMQLLESAYQAQVRALDLVWMLQEEVGGVASVSPEPASYPSSSKKETAPSLRRQGPGELMDDVRAALPRLPETFTHLDMAVALGYQPDRGSLYRVLQGLVDEGSIRREVAGIGRKPTIYSRTGG